MQRARVYRKGVLEADGFDPDLISAYLEESDTVIWLDLCHPTDEELKLLGEEFGLHDLALEDVKNGRQRAKFENYVTYGFVTLYAVGLEKPTAELGNVEVSAFVSPRYLITVRKTDFNMDEVVRRWDNNMKGASSGAGFLLHGLLDYVVDGYFEAVETLDAGIEELEDFLFDGTSLSNDVQRDSFAMRKALVGLRRAVLPVREVVNSLLRRE